MLGNAIINEKAEYLISSRFNYNIYCNNNDDDNNNIYAYN